jgi:hypothetical protein
MMHPNYRSVTHLDEQHVNYFATQTAGFTGSNITGKYPNTFF